MQGHLSISVGSFALRFKSPEMVAKSDSLSWKIKLYFGDFCSILLCFNIFLYFLVVQYIPDSTIALKGFSNHV